jgi:hypothetical protein
MMHHRTLLAASRINDKKLKVNQIIKFLRSQLHVGAAEVGFIVKPWMCANGYVMLQAKGNRIFDGLVIARMIAARNIGTADERHNSRIVGHALAHVAVEVNG